MEAPRSDLKIKYVILKNLSEIFSYYEYSYFIP